jgi:Transposase DDE domain
MFTRDEFIIYVYCLLVQYVDQLFPTRLRKRGGEPALSDEEALTIELVGESLGMESDKEIYRYFRYHYRARFPALPDRSTLVRQWQNLWRVKYAIWQAIVRESGAWRDPIQLIDPFPVPVCHVRRAAARGIFLDDLLYQPSYGYCAAKKWHSFGFKGGLWLSSPGMILAAPILPASPHDIDLLEPLLLGVPAYTRVFGDKGFIDLEQQTTLKDSWGILVKTPLRHNMTDRVEFRLHPLESRLRQLIETVTGQLVGRFHAQLMRVRKGWTLAAKWYRKLLTHTICVFTNLKYGNTPTQLEALVCD